VSTRTKKDLIEAVAIATGKDKEVVRDIVQSLLGHMVDALATGQRIEIRDFGVFEVKKRGARTAQNPKTLQRVVVPPKASVKFKPGRLLREQVEGESILPEPPEHTADAHRTTPPHTAADDPNPPTRRSA
jgi:integration host factor subunit beta